MSSTQRSTEPRRRLNPPVIGTLTVCAVAGVAFAVTTMLPSDKPAADYEVVAEAQNASLEAIEVVAAPAEVVPEILEPEPFDYGDCPPVARACVDLDGERAWLQADGVVTYGAVPIGQGGLGYETPRSSFHVSRKVIDDVSYAFDLAPMPYAVYFTNVGHAFHEGDPAGDSHGCVRLAPGDAEVYFNTLQVGDMIHIY